MRTGNERIDVLCFGGGDWWYHNRGHIDMQLMRRFAKNGKVLYVNSIVIQKPNIFRGDRFLHKFYRKGKSIIKGLKRSDSGFWVYSPVSLPLHHIWWARVLNEKLVRSQVCHIVRKLGMRNPLVWVSCPGACDIAVNMIKNKLIWQRTDRWEEFPNVDFETIKSYDRKLKAKADLTVYVNRSLYDQEANQCKKAIYLDHGVDYEMFASVEQVPDRAEDISEVQKPIVGYFGAIDDHKLDFGFVEAVIDLLPKISFVFIGKASSRLSRLADKKNVWMLGQKSYEHIPYYGTYFDVAIIPWRQSQWTKVANPIKFKEYLALGKPVVSTPVFTELQKYLDVVYVANTPEGFAKCIEKALIENSSEHIAKRRNKVKNDSWESKAQLLLSELFRENKSSK